MTCHHRPGDPDCSKSGGGWVREAAQAEARETRQRLKELEANKPNPDQYEITKAERVGQHLVLEVTYPSCAKCAYEGRKVMVFLNVGELQSLRWCRVDPHFRDPTHAGDLRQAPPPAARFPASEEGWQDALDYAARKGTP